MEGFREEKAKVTWGTTRPVKILIITSPSFKYHSLSSLSFMQRSSQNWNPFRSISFLLLCSIKPQHTAFGKLKRFFNIIFWFCFVLFCFVCFFSFFFSDYYQSIWVLNSISTYYYCSSWSLNNRVYDFNLICCSLLIFFLFCSCLEC